MLINNIIIVFLLFIYCDSIFETTRNIDIDFDILAKLAARYKFSFLEEQCYFMLGVVSNGRRHFQIWKLV